ncbi:MAG: hypothetical protein RI842_09965, partial [Schleiferiaceae bacterium]|nr:hypothetical protein [Schleiferiaceae bacterium]
ISLSLFAFSSLRAQPGHLSSSAQSLHHLFKLVDTVTNPSADLHYDRSGHLVDERYFDISYLSLSVPGFYYLRASSIDSQFQVSFIKK